MRKRVSKRQKAKRERKQRTQKGGMFSGNFNTYLDYLSQDAFIPFNEATGTGADPIAPIMVHDARLDPQAPITPVFIGGKRSKKNRKARRTRRKMKGGQSLTTDFGGTTSISNNPVVAMMNTPQAPTLAAMAYGNSGVSSDLTLQPLTLGTGSTLVSNHHLV
jgi:hypothetical protein